jgi:YD repeat-containing protein
MRQLFLLAFIALAFASCKKDDPAPAPAPVTAGKLLKKITKTENGSTIVYNLLYDAASRLTSIKSTDNSEVTLLTYDAAGNLVKIDETESGFHNIYSYVYLNGNPVSANFKSWEKQAGAPDELIEDDVLTYTVQGGKVTGIHMLMADGSESEFSLTYTNGNLTKVNTVGSDFYSATFTWGSKKSPYPPASKFVLDQAGFSLLLFSKNEMLSTVYDFPGTLLDKTVTVQYTYDAAGYPITSNDGEAQLQYEYQ